MRAYMRACVPVCVLRMHAYECDDVCYVLSNEYEYPYVTVHANIVCCSPYEKANKRKYM